MGISSLPVIFTIESKQLFTVQNTILELNKASKEAIPYPPQCGEN